jgi:HigB_toxin, RelE-like toxic component of a toxin-antitoxin system
MMSGGDRCTDAMANARGCEALAPEGEHSQGRPRGVQHQKQRLVTAIKYPAGVMVIRFFGTHAEYDAIDAETV